MESQASFTPTPRTTLRRRPHRGSYDRALIHSILDEAPICFVGFAVEGQPYVVPTTFGRVGERLYLHGAVANRTLRHLASGIEMCVTVTILDGFVLSRTAFHHSMNYRSAMLFGVGREVTDPAERYRAFEAMVNHMVPGLFETARKPSEEEIRATSVVALDITEASAKVRGGPPVDSEEDCALPYWAGVVPLKLMPQAPLPDPTLRPGTPVPPEVAAFVEERRRGR